MINEQLGNLLAAFADFYWAIPLRYVTDKIKTWHPEVTENQLKGVLKKCNKDLYCYHCCVATKGVAEPELVAEHLLACGNDLDNFLAVRKDLPICEYDEETLLAFHDELPDTPESQEIVTFAMKELGEKRGKDLAEGIRFMQNCALCEGDSWVKSILKTWQYGEKTFKTLEQVKQCRELGNKLYQVMPNPVLRGWKPTDIANAPVPKDDIPDRDEDIPHMDMSDFFDPIGEMEHIEDTVMQGSFEARQKIGRNDPCPCGSGKKYKKCCGAGKNSD